MKPNDFINECGYQVTWPLQLLIKEETLLLQHFSTPCYFLAFKSHWTKQVLIKVLKTQVWVITVRLYYWEPVRIYCRHTKETKLVRDLWNDCLCVSHRVITVCDRCKAGMKNKKREREDEEGDRGTQVFGGQWQRERWIEWYLHAGKGLEQDWAGSRWLDRGKRIYTHTLITALYWETITPVHTYALHHMQNKPKQPTFFTSLFTHKNKTHTFEWRTSLAILKRPKSTKQQCISVLSDFPRLSAALFFKAPWVPAQVIKWVRKISFHS